MDVDAIAMHLVHAIFDGVDAACDWLLVDADVISQTPAKQHAVGVEVVGRASHVRKVEGLDLGMAGGERLRQGIDVGRAASSDDHETRGEAGQEQCAGCVV